MSYVLLVNWKWLAHLLQKSGGMIKSPTKAKGERRMFKKYRLIVAMLIVGLVSTGFGQSVGASASTGDSDSQTRTHKYVYHGKVDQNHYAELENFLAKYFSKWNIQ